MPSHAANSLGGYATGSGTGTTATTGTFSAALTAGSAIAVLIDVTRDGATAITVTDTGGNSYARVSGDPTTTTQGGIIFAAYNISTTGASDTVAVAFNDVNAVAYVIAVEIKGAKTTAAYDVDAPTGTRNAQLPAGTGTDAVTSTAATPSENGEFILGVSKTGDSGDLTAGTGFTNIVTISTLKAEYLVQGTAASIAATFTIGASANTYTQMATFKEAAGGGGAVSNFYFRRVQP